MAATARRCEGNRRPRYFRSYAGQCRPQDFGQWDHPGRPLGLESLVEGGQGHLGARLADVGQVGVDDGGVERLVTQVGADLAQGDAFLQEVGGKGVTIMPSSA